MAVAVPIAAICPFSFRRSWSSFCSLSSLKRMRCPLTAPVSSRNASASNCAYKYDPSLRCSQSEMTTLFWRCAFSIVCCHLVSPVGATLKSVGKMDAFHFLTRIT